MDLGGRDRMGIFGFGAGVGGSREVAVIQWEHYFDHRSTGVMGCVRRRAEGKDQ